MYANPYLSRHFSIWRDAEQPMVRTEQAVFQFSRCPKSRYNLGQDLRRLAKQALSHVTHAISQKAHRCHRVERWQNRKLYRFVAQCRWFLTHNSQYRVWVQKGRHFINARQPDPEYALSQLAQLFIPANKIQY